VPPFVKRNPNAPIGLFGYEAAGLRWLAAAEAGVPCVPVLAQDATSLTLTRLAVVRPDVAPAHEFGRRLARTHATGAAGFGAPPDGWPGLGFFGPMNHPLPMSLTGHGSWGTFYARERLAPMAQRADPYLDGALRRELDHVIDRCANGDFDDDDGPARLHGDLWSGNVMWTSAGAVLIDPAAHGGHRETDLAMLALFGCPHYAAVIDGYQQERPLRPGWRQRIGLHQLYPLLAHVVLFGAGYLPAVSEATSSALTQADRLS
jgi:fructosamine-3-kinase